MQSLSSHNVRWHRRIFPLGLALTALLIACSHQDAATTSMPFNGTWSSPNLAYDMELQGPFGLAVRSRSDAVKDGDPVFRMIDTEEHRFSGRQWLADGKWHTVTGELKQDGKLYLTDGTGNWTLEKQR
jgi:hypothetical protein